MLNTAANFLWLASYPKSGNTWVRLFLTTLIKNDDPNLSKIDYNSFTSSREFTDQLLGLNSSDLPESDYLKYRSNMYAKYAGQIANQLIPCKIHDACSLDDYVLFPQKITRGVIYILRNPFDIVASLSNHKVIDIESSAALLCDNSYTMSRKTNGLNKALSQYVGTWSNHVKSWTDVHSNNMLIVKYEDIVADPLKEFLKITGYMELNYSREDIEIAVNKTNINNLQKLEQQEKFMEAPRVEKFFRTGKAGNWRNEITIDQAEKIIACNYDILLKYNYINNTGDILV
jgi:aryl sulfotransferase